MNTVKYIQVSRYLLMLIMLSYSLPVYAQEARFESLSDGIVDALTQGKPNGAKSTDPTGFSNIAESTPRHANSVNLKIEFDVNSSTIRDSSYSVLNELCHALQNKRLKNRQITIIGHTDSDGSAVYNQRLSEKRAQSVKRYLLKKCDLQNRSILTRGYGDRFPILPNTNAQNKQKNRRVEIQAVSEAASMSTPADSSRKKKQSVEFKSLNDF